MSSSESRDEDRHRALRRARHCHSDNKPARPLLYPTSYFQPHQKEEVPTRMQTLVREGLRRKVRQFPMVISRWNQLEPTYTRFLRRHISHCIRFLMCS